MPEPFDDAVSFNACTCAMQLAVHGKRGRGERHALCMCTLAQRAAVSPFWGQAPGAATGTLKHAVYEWDVQQWGERRLQGCAGGCRPPRTPLSFAGGPEMWVGAGAGMSGGWCARKYKRALNPHLPVSLPSRRGIALAPAGTGAKRRPHKMDSASRSSSDASPGAGRRAPSTGRLPAGGLRRTQRCRSRQGTGGSSHSRLRAWRRSGATGAASYWPSRPWPRAWQPLRPRTALRASAARPCRRRRPRSIRWRLERRHRPRGGGARCALVSCRRAALDAAQAGHCLCRSRRQRRGPPLSAERPLPHS